MNVTLGSIALSDVQVDMRIDFRLSRRMEQGAKGDDMVVEGRKSREFVLRGTMDPEGFDGLLTEVQEHDGHMFESPLGSCKVVVKTIQYSSATKSYYLVLIEDIL